MKKPLLGFIFGAILITPTSGRVLTGTYTFTAAV